MEPQYAVGEPVWVELDEDRTGGVVRDWTIVNGKFEYHVQVAGVVKRCPQNALAPREIVDEYGGD